MVNPKHARLTGVILLLVVFAVGALTGAATVHVVEAKDGPTRVRVVKPSLFERLELTPEQEVEVRRVLERRRAEMDAFWEEHGPTVRTIYDSARAEIRSVLTPEQRELDDRFMAERRKHIRIRDGGALRKGRR